VSQKISFIYKIYLKYINAEACCALPFDTDLAIRSEIRRNSVWNVFLTWLEVERFFLHYASDNASHTIGVEYLGEGQ